MASFTTGGQLQVAIEALKKCQAEAGLSAAEVHALRSLTNFLSSYRSSSGAPGDADDALGSDEDGEIAEAFTYSSRTSGALQRERLLPDHGKRCSLGLEPSGESCNGVLPSDPEVQEMLKQIDSWIAFNVFQLLRRTDGRPLETVSVALLKQLGLIEELQLPLDKLMNFMRAIERKYANNPYHNSLHAADVVQTVGAIIIMDNLREQMTPLELLSVVVAAVVHDVGHPGVSNDFLINTAHEAAITYNDNSVNENFHCACAFRVLQKPHNNFLDHLGKESFKFVRSLVVDLVLSTDMKEHHTLLSDFMTDVGLFGADLSSWGAVPRTRGLCLLLHAADISNCVKPLHLAVEWAKKVTQEFQEQGDKERMLGLPVSPLNDRANANIPRSQKVFLELFGRPTYEALARIAPVSGAMALSHYETNMGHWQELIKQGVTTL